MSDRPIGAHAQHWHVLPIERERILARYQTTFRVAAIMNGPVCYAAADPWHYNM